jgi:hypothetical protein
MYMLRPMVQICQSANWPANRLTGIFEPSVVTYIKEKSPILNLASAAHNNEVKGRANSDCVPTVFFAFHGICIRCVGIC